jgi:hypothetical protein
MGTRRLAAFAFASALVAAGLLGACSNGTPSAGGAPTATATVPAPPTDGSSADQPSPLPSVIPPVSSAVVSASKPDVPAPTQLEQTLTGQVEAGVERGCLILRDTTGTYQLLGGDPTIVYAGADVSLTGHVVTGVMSYCMQGKPFQITQAIRR